MENLDAVSSCLAVLVVLGLGFCIGMAVGEVKRWKLRRAVEMRAAVIAEQQGTIDNLRTERDQYYKASAPLFRKQGGAQ